MTGHPEAQPGAALVSVTDIARARGVSRQRADELTRHPGFPRPVPAAGRVRRWWDTDVAEFFAKPRPAGRPRKTRRPEETS